MPLRIAGSFQPFGTVARLNRGRIGNGVPLAIDNCPFDRGQPSELDLGKFHGPGLRWRRPLREFRRKSVGVDFEDIGVFGCQRRRFDDAVGSSDKGGRLVSR